MQQSESKSTQNTVTLIMPSLALKAVFVIVRHNGSSFNKYEYSN